MPARVSAARSSRASAARGRGLARDLPTRVDRVQEVGGLVDGEAFIVFVVLDVARAACGADNPAEALCDRAVDVQFAEFFAAAEVVNDERVIGGEDRRVDPRAGQRAFFVFAFEQLDNVSG
jgi:hypothetical protein